MPSAGASTVVAEPRWPIAAIVLGSPILGAVAGWFSRDVAGWLATLPWFPRQRLLEFIASSSEWPRTAVGVVVGGLAGLVLADKVAKERLVVTVALDRVVLARSGTGADEHGRTSIGAAFVDRGQIVLTDRAGAERAREKCDVEASRLREAFVEHGYPWRDADPYANDYRRWVPGTSALSASAHALLRARAQALANQKKLDADELRTELVALGIAVRDQDDEQYWRRLPGGG